ARGTSRGARREPLGYRARRGPPLGRVGAPREGVPGRSRRRERPGTIGTLWSVGPTIPQGFPLPRRARLRGGVLVWRAGREYDDAARQLGGPKEREIPWLSADGRAFRPGAFTGVHGAVNARERSPLTGAIPPGPPPRLDPLAGLASASRQRARHAP